MSVPAPREMICFVCEGEGEERKASIRISRAVVRAYVPVPTH